MLAAHRCFETSFKLDRVSSSTPDNRERKTNKHKEFWRDTPWFVSHLSRGHVPSVPSSVPFVPRTLCPLNVNSTLSSAQTQKISRRLELSISKKLRESFCESGEGVRLPRERG